MSYDFSAIERKWQEKWDEKQAFRTELDKSKPKYYALVEFPYPSGQGLHIGHPRPYTALDIVSRKKRMQGFNVLFPMGWDAFGLPTENYAIKNKIHPAKVTKQNVARFKGQLKMLGFSFDWSREINTTDPAYVTPSEIWRLIPTRLRVRFGVIRGSFPIRGVVIDLNTLRSTRSTALSTATNIGRRRNEPIFG